MTTKQRIERIRTAIALHDKLAAEWEKLIAVIRTHDMPLFDQSWLVFDAYVEAIAREVGDDFGWIKWFISDNDCGRAGHKASAGYGDPKQEISTLEALVALIERKGP